MLSKMIILMFLLSVILFTRGYAMEKKSNVFFIDKEQLNLSKPDDDLKKNISINNMRFIRVCGFVCLYPGVDPKDVSIAESYGSMTIKGPGGDVIEKDVEEYAAVYNRKLLEQIKMKESINEKEKI